MIHTINIVTNTRAGDAYDKVSVNPYPIIYIDDTDTEQLVNDPDFIDVVRKYIKNKIIYNNATINIRSLSEDMESSKTTSFILKDNIILKEWI